MGARPDQGPRQDEDDVGLRALQLPNGVAGGSPHVGHGHADDPGCRRGVGRALRRALGVRGGLEPQHDLGRQPFDVDLALPGHASEPSGSVAK